MAVHYLDSGNDDGTVLGYSTSSKIGFYGATPVDRPATVADATNSTTVITSLNTLIDRLQELGLIA